MLDRDRRSFMFTRQLGLTKTYNLIHDPAVKDVEVQRLREIHAEIDGAVCAAYGWENLPLQHNHYETSQGVRWTVSPSARVEIVDRLLELNHRLYAEEPDAAEKASTKRKARRKTTVQPAEDTLFDSDEDS